MCLLGHLDARVEHKGDDGEVTCRFRFTGPTLDQAIAELGRRRCRLTSPPSARPTSATPPTTRPCSRHHEGAVAAPTAGLHFTPELEAALRDARRRDAPDDAACRRGHLPAGQGRRYRRPPHACRVGRRLALRRPTRSTRRAPGGSRIVAVGTTSLRLLESAAGRRRHDRAVCRRDRDLHHAGLPLSRGRHAADQFSPAALDAVHAGVGLLRSRDHERAYAHAIADGYRFYSYGDACLLFRA